MDSDMVQDPHLIQFIPQYRSHMHLVHSRSLVHIKPLPTSVRSLLASCDVYSCSHPPLSWSVYTHPTSSSLDGAATIKLDCRCIHGSSPTKSMQTPSAASCPTQTLLTLTLASACSALPRIACGTASTLLRHTPQLHAVTQPVLHLTVI